MANSHTLLNANIIVLFKCMIVIRWIDIRGWYNVFCNYIHDKSRKKHTMVMICGGKEKKKYNSGSWSFALSFWQF